MAPVLVEYVVVVSASVNWPCSQQWYVLMQLSPSARQESLGGTTLGSSQLWSRNTTTLLSCVPLPTSTFGVRGPRMYWKSEHMSESACHVENAASIAVNSESPGVFALPAASGVYVKLRTDQVTQMSLSTAVRVRRYWAWASALMSAS